jgi:hypothetical protein
MTIVGWREDVTTPKSLEIVAEFMVKVIGAVVAFLALGGAAIALNLFNSFAESRDLVPLYIGYGMTGLEYVIFALDAICFGYFLVLEAIRFLTDITAVS